MDALIKIQTELKAPKTQNNAFGKYKYRKAEDIMLALKPHLKETNSLLYLTDELVLIGSRYYIKATATFINGEFSLSVCGFAREEEDKKGMDGSQVTGASSSYARKYALNALFLIDDNKDSDETNDHTDKEDEKIKSGFFACRSLDELKEYFLSLSEKNQKYYNSLATQIKEELTSNNKK